MLGRARGTKGLYQTDKSGRGGGGRGITCENVSLFPSLLCVSLPHPSSLPSAASVAFPSFPFNSEALCVYGSIVAGGGTQTKKERKEEETKPNNYRPPFFPPGDGKKLGRRQMPLRGGEGKRRKGQNARTHGLPSLIPSFFSPPSPFFPSILLEISSFFFSESDLFAPNSGPPSPLRPTAAASLSSPSFPSFELSLPTLLPAMKSPRSLPSPPKLPPLLPACPGERGDGGGQRFAKTSITFSQGMQQFLNMQYIPVEQMKELKRAAGCS